ncbi:DUF4331 family protein [Phaeodactylibacter sp.]|uniref:DUF4331 family protein n=1 Tax=Phaeodactylibacter sp. TaxID=1940289 RepID=UPI0025FFE812|nr:DUF4331 family protein [Phaeodactylibacter sp.]MCI4646707.1 DUF4331 family protein [Phaeodactylibacter sp.]MCI5089472.1 DUF4331 family protein [Phaeodactylibacter sp.]
MLHHRFKFIFTAVLLLLFCGSEALQASSHREAPLISNDPLADNVDVYAFRSPDNPRNIVLIATYVPMQLPHGGPNYYQFGENIRYEIHIDNDASRPGDEIVYRFTFEKKNEDPSTFFNIRLGQENLMTRYTVEKSINGGGFIPILVNGKVPPNNVGERSISSPVGLNADYAELFEDAVRSAHTGEKIFAGPVDDPFFVDLGGIFDLGDAPRQMGDPRDGLACLNTSAIALEIPIQFLLKKGAPSSPENILDPNYVIGVWASASRPQIRTLEPGSESYDGDWVQVSRLGMPLTNEAVIPIGMKDYWNALTPYQELEDTLLDNYFYNPELALYMDDSLFGGAVPAFGPLRIQRNALQSFDFGNGQDGLFPLKGTAAVEGTALDDDIFGTLLLPGPGMPRSVDLWPAFHTGVPNFPPYQLATGKEGNPLAAGKPFVNNFLPNGGDMLRLNMAVPATPRDNPAFSSLGLIQAAVLGLTDPTYNGTADLEFIPNMDGFPNGRRLEDDVTRIELQAVSGVVLAAIGLWYDDYTAGDPNPVTDDLLGVLTYTTGVEANDKPFRPEFPYLAMPFAGDGECSGTIAGLTSPGPQASALNLTTNTTGQVQMMAAAPNPFQGQTTLQYRLEAPQQINISLYDVNGRQLSTLVDQPQEAGTYTVDWQAGQYPEGVYFARAVSGSGETLQIIKLVKTN